MFNLKRLLESKKIDRRIKRQIEKLSNEYQELKYDQIPSIPSTTVEISNICNLNCEMCGTQYATRPKKQMDWNIFTKAVDQLCDLGVKMVRTYTINEPFVNNNIIEILEYLDKKGMMAYFSTNGMLVDKFIEKVKDTNFRNFEIKFSIDAAKKETYERIRKGAKFEKVIENLKLVYDYKKKYHKNLKVGLVYLVSNDTLGEIPLFFKNYSKYFNKDCMFFAFLTEHDLLGKGNKFEEGRVNYKSYLNVPCSDFAYNNLAILNTGDYSICCNDYNAEITYGNIEEQSLGEALKGEKLKKLRDAHFNKDLKALPKPCVTCKMPARFTQTILNMIMGYAIKGEIAINNIPYHIRKVVNEYDQKIDSLYGLPKV